jgi:pyridoxal phosphate enzyme (YggS family)
MSIKNSLETINKELDNNNCKLIAVSKTKPNEAIKAAYDVGQRHFGENKAQELASKNEALPNDINWHMIGHLQRNKVKYIAPFVYLIHGVDSERLLLSIDKEAKKCNRVIDCLLQIHIATESSKFGFNEAELNEFLNSDRFSILKNINIVGLMGMATNTDDAQQVKEEFIGLKDLSGKIITNFNAPNLNLKELSMGMSGDYKIALEAGSTMVRIGSAIFGARNYG